MSAGEGQREEVGGTSPLGLGSEVGLVPWGAKWGGAGGKAWGPGTPGRL